MNSTILLDFDGVIVDSIEFFCEAVNVVGRKLIRRVSIEPDDLRNIKHMSILEISNVAGIEKNLLRAFVTEIDGGLSRRADEIPIFPHMTDVIEKLSMVGSLGIVSATSRPVISKVLQNYEIERFVRHIASGDMPGAKSMKIKSIIQDNGSGLGKACMVGDTVSDIEQGKIAGGRRSDGAGARTCPNGHPCGCARWCVPPPDQAPRDIGRSTPRSRFACNPHAVRATGENTALVSIFNANQQHTPPERLLPLVREHRTG